MIHAIGRNIWRSYHHLRFRLYDHRRHDHLVLERVSGFDLLVLPGVFNPALFWTSELLADYLRSIPIGHHTRVLDLGTGSGIGAVCAAQRSHAVTAIDINPEAVRCARINTILNRVEDRVELLIGDLFQPVAGRKFDLVLFNPPFFRGRPGTALEAAFYGGDLPEKFAYQLPGHLSEEAICLIILSTNGEERNFLEALEKNQLRVAAVQEKTLPGETLTIYLASLQTAERARRADADPL